MAQAALPLMIAGSLVQGIGGYSAGKFNQKVAKANAVNDERDGVAQAAQVRTEARYQMGEQVGAQAESGFMPGTGSAIDSLKQSAINAQLDILNVKRRSASAAKADSEQAYLQGQSANMAMLGGITGAASAIASHSANYASANSAYGYGH